MQQLVRPVFSDYKSILTKRREWDAVQYTLLYLTLVSYLHNADLNVTLYNSSLDELFQQVESILFKQKTTSKTHQSKSNFLGIKNNHIKLNPSILTSPASRVNLDQVKSFHMTLLFTSNWYEIDLLSESTFSDPHIGGGPHPSFYCLGYC